MQQTSLPDAEHLVTPEPGNIIGGTVFLVTAFEDENLTAYYVQSNFRHPVLTPSCQPEAEHVTSFYCYGSCSS